MQIKNLKTKLIALITAFFICFISFSCGTIFYPERKGQISGKINPGVAVLDGLGLLFFLVPGVIAFAVDFSNGTIYLPHGNFAENKLEIDKMKKIKSQSQLTQSEIERIVKENTGKEINFELAEITAISE